MSRRFCPPTESDFGLHGSVYGKPYVDAHAERIRAHEKHDHPESPSMERRPFDDPCWVTVLVEEVGEVCMAINDHRHSSTPDFATLKAEVRKELVQVAAMVTAWIDAVDLDERRPA
jgi:hypothetical protein